jgi:hypothetical protein
MLLLCGCRPMKPNSTGSGGQEKQKLKDPPDGKKHHG